MANDKCLDYRIKDCVSAAKWKGFKPNAKYVLNWGKMVAITPNCVNICSQFNLSVKSALEFTSYCWTT